MCLNNCPCTSKDTLTVKLHMYSADVQSTHDKSTRIRTVGDKIKFPLCTDSPPTCERSYQQKSPKSRPKVASDFRRTLKRNQ